MVRLTVELIATSRNHFRKKRGLSFPEYLRTLTHLHFFSKDIEDIGDLSMCRNLTVLYLYDNHISHICNLAFARNLTHLYLQNNDLTRMDNLHHLQRLSKLYLGGNRILVVEGLENVPDLSELHLENQRLNPGEKLLLDPTTLLCLAESLCVLNINNNNIDDIRDLTVLKELRHFSAADNRLNNLEELEDVLCAWPRLLRADLRGNPACKSHRYRDRLITAGGSLQALDGREVKGVTRQFLLRWKACREARRRGPARSGAPTASPGDFPAGQGPRAGQSCFSPEALQRWKPQQPSLRAQRLKLSMSGLLSHVSVPSSLLCSQVDA
ncbi:hypothetical protein CesoFtcFv8_025136 [Champsocephalus esox]|uniref:Protein phosphatase 1 regulatory subunit 42 n=1 Tax=Champsocephalus esox TaxID=159716 RepID=A0AAN8B3V7_9TELE|nr:hypothetical protein CesoFtcFv8_025136 [Champsocephalus esox]